MTRIVRVPVVRTVWRTRTISVRRDPLAQTFSFTENRGLSAVGIQFTERDASISVTVQIRGITTGLLNDTIFAEKVIAPSGINLGGGTKIIFDDPFCAEANTNYAVVLLTNSTTYKVRTATLGKTGHQGIIRNSIFAK